LVNLFLVIGLGKYSPPYLYLNLRTRTRYPMAETWDLRMRPATCHPGLPPATRNEIT